MEVGESFVMQKNPGVSPVPMANRRTGRKFRQQSFMQHGKRFLRIWRDA